jgi:hypothetical protein
MIISIGVCRFRFRFLNKLGFLQIRKLFYFKWKLACFHSFRIWKTEILKIDNEFGCIAGGEECCINVIGDQEVGLHLPCALCRKV